MGAGHVTKMEGRSAFKMLTDEPTRKDLYEGPGVDILEYTVYSYECIYIYIYIYIFEYILKK